MPSDVRTIHYEVTQSGITIDGLRLGLAAGFYPPDASPLLNRAAGIYPSRIIKHDGPCPKSHGKYQAIHDQAAKVRKLIDKNRADAEDKAAKITAEREKAAGDAAVEAHERREADAAEKAKEQAEAERRAADKKAERGPAEAENKDGK